MDTTTRSLLALAALALSLGAPGCGAAPAASTPEDDGTRYTESAVQWWNSYITYEHVVLGWNDTDLGVSSSSPVQLRNPAKLVSHGVYAWGYMPEFIDQKTGQYFRFLHLRPQHQYATHVGEVYPAGFIVGLSGGDTYDTGYGVYSTGAHLCVQTLASFRACFPYGSAGGGSGAGSTSGGGESDASGIACHSGTLDRTVAAGTCVQSSKDADWYHCDNGNWVFGEKDCTSTYGWCSSYTLGGRSVPPRACVQSKVDKVWYQCDEGWRGGVSNGSGPLGPCSVEYRL